MSAKLLRTFAPGKRAFAGASARRGAPVFGALRVGGSGAGAPGRDAFAGNERLVTAEMRGFAAAISSVRVGRDSIGQGRVA
jgi:hypothetical protein